MTPEVLLLNGSNKVAWLENWLEVKFCGVEFRANFGVKFLVEVRSSGLAQEVDLKVWSRGYNFGLKLDRFGEFEGERRHGIKFWAKSGTRLSTEFWTGVWTG